MRIHAFWCVFLVDCILSESSFSELNSINNLLFHYENFNNAEDSMVVTVSPVNADRTGYQTNRMRSYLNCTHIEVVNVLCVGHPIPDVFCNTGINDIGKINTGIDKGDVIK